MNEEQQVRFRELWYRYENEMTEEMEEAAPIPKGALLCHRSSIRELVRVKYVRRIQREIGIPEEELFDNYHKGILEEYPKTIDELTLEDFKMILEEWETRIRKEIENNPQRDIVIPDFLKPDDLVIED